MEPVPDPSYPTIVVSNFGPISKARIEVAPITLFFGASNTGKSYAAVLLYALFNSLSIGGRRRTMHYRGSNRAHPTEYLFIRDKAPAKVKSAVLDWLSSSPTIETVKHADLPHELASYLDLVGPQYRASLARYFQSEIERCFGTSITSLRRQGTRAPISIEVTTGDFFSWRVETHNERLVEQSYNLHPSLRSYYLFGYGYHIGRFAASESKASRDEHAYELIDDFIRFLVSQSLGLALSALPNDTYYLPASRSGLLQNQELFVAAAAQRLTEAGIRPIRESVLTGVIGDFLADVFSSYSYGGTATRRIATLLEKTFLKGKVSFKKGGARELVYGEGGSQIPLSRASSMVAELAPFVHILRHSIDVGDCIIFEEPEAHLHPAKQVMIAGVLAMLAKQGIRVIATTHSDYLVKQLGNLLRAGSLSARELKRLSIGPGQTLDDHELQAYLFEALERGSGSRVSAVNVNDEVGIDHSDAGQVAASLYNQSASIHNIRNRS